MNNYIFATEFIIRTPANSFDYLKQSLSKDVETLYGNQELQDAIYIASKDLYDEFKKYSSLDEKEKKKVSNSFIRYVCRMSTRCTPFGLFAGCAVGNMGEYTNCTVKRKFIRHTRLDMNYLCSLSQHLSNIEEIKFRIKYYPNNSLYLVGNKYRYIEYQYMKNERIHQVISVNKTNYLDKIISLSKKGATIDTLYPSITNEYIQKEDAINYINELIQSQVLVSELDPTISGDDFLTRIINNLCALKIEHQIIEKLKNVQNILMQIDASKKFPLFKYRKIESIVESIGIPYNNKYLFQVDINNIYSKATIGLSIRKEIESTLTFLNKTTKFRENRNLLEFQKRFAEQFEEKEVPLLIALDPEIGVGYPIDYNKEVSQLLDDFLLPNSYNLRQNANDNLIQSVLQKKIIDNKTMREEIEVTDDDFKEINESWDDLPSTLSVFFEIIKDKKDDVLIKLKSIGGSSAANLLARFAYTDKKIENLVREITYKEQFLNHNVILAEIVHLPDSRVGNILYRPHLRDYEIAYLANSSLSKDKTLYASDIMLSVKKGRLFLRSKRYNKEVIPRLTNAHNYALSNIPVYRFLCDMQSQNQRVSLFFDLGSLYNELSYMPRIRYKHTILSPATWNIKTEEIKSLFLIENEIQLLQEIKEWCETKHIQQYSLLSDGDNELFIDWNNMFSIRTFISVVKNRTGFRLKEFLYSEKNTIVKDKDGSAYLNECIVILLKK